MTEGSIEERGAEIRQAFEERSDWMKRYEYLVDLGDEVPSLEPKQRTEEHYIHSCQYDLWLRADYDDDQDVLRFRAHSDSKITRGLAALLVHVLDGQPPEAVANADLDFLNDTGLRNELSSQRKNGLSGMVHQMRAQARNHLDPNQD